MFDDDEQTCSEPRGAGEQFDIRDEPLEFSRLAHQIPMDRAQLALDAFKKQGPDGMWRDTDIVTKDEVRSAVLAALGVPARPAEKPRATIKRIGFIEPSSFGGPRTALDWSFDCRGEAIPLFDGERIAGWPIDELEQISRAAHPEHYGLPCEPKQESRPALDLLTESVVGKKQAANELQRLRADALIRYDRASESNSSDQREAYARFANACSALIRYG